MSSDHRDAVPTDTWHAQEADLRLRLKLAASAPERAGLRTQVAEVCWMTGRDAEAGRLFALARADLAGVAEPEPLLTGIRLGEAALALSRGDPDAAEQPLREAERYLATAFLPVERARAADCRARLLLQRGDPFAARQVVTEALAAPHPAAAEPALNEVLVVACLGVGDVPGSRDAASRARDALAARTPLERAWFEWALLRIERAALDASPAADDSRERWDEYWSRGLHTALAMDALRRQLGTGYARSQWEAATAEVFGFAFEAAQVRGDSRGALLLVDFRACSGQLSGASVLPGTDGALGSPVTAGAVLGLPPQLGYPDAGAGLAAEVRQAAAWFGTPIRSDRVVPTLPPATGRPTVHLRMTDAGNTYQSWQWSGCAEPPGVGVVPAAQRDAALAALAAALPDPLPGEDQAAALRRALSGALADPAAEGLLAEQLSRAFLPARLADALGRLVEAGARPLVRVQPSPLTAAVPWALLGDRNLRLVEVADLESAAPLGLRPVEAPVRTWVPGSPMTLVLDPRVPGQRADSGLGSVLGRPDPGSALAGAVVRVLARTGFADAADAVRSSAVDRDWLSRELQAGPGALVYVGHVTHSGLELGQAEDSALHLADTGECIGFAAATDGHRPLSALDLFAGTAALDADGRPGTELWPAPPRVALLGCRSGGDAGCTDAFGPASAFVQGGAGHVLVTRWTLPTDRLWASGVRPLDRLAADAIALVDAPDPVVALGDLQRDRLREWRRSADPADGPLVWGALTCLTP